ncbi:MAG: sigma-70 family RNA polymerase sigma factor [Solirubrobacteraceae bacterium]
MNRACIARHDHAIASDAALMSKIANGDGAAFDELYRRHSPNALIQARRLCASAELAEDVAQEMFISLWRGASRYRPALGSVSVWLSSLLRNRAIDAWRRTTVRPTEVPQLEDGPGQLRAAIGADVAPVERSVMLGLIAGLPRAQKEAVFLAYFGDMTHAEIAMWAGEPLGTIKGRLRLGLNKLRAQLEEQAEPVDVAPAVTPVARLEQKRQRRGPAAVPARRLTAA